MNSHYFVSEHSIVRQIWGRSDTILVIFAGASAEFALNKAVDWLYFTGQLPNDPMGRLFRTVGYAQKIVFADRATALKAIDSMAAIHRGVEVSRGRAIPEWAYRDVLFMLIDYSIRAFELLERPLLKHEKEEVFDVFQRMGERMGINGLPGSFPEWEIMRQDHLKMHLQVSAYTKHLFSQYHSHLGAVRYGLLREVQALVVPTHIHQLLRLPVGILARPLVSSYRLSKKMGLDALMRRCILPARFRPEIQQLDRSSAHPRSSKWISHPHFNPSVS